MQRRNALGNITNSPGGHVGHLSPLAGKPIGMSGPRFSPRTGVASLGGLRPQVPGLQQPRLQFVGHAIETRLPPDLCLLGCIFVITDYQVGSTFYYIFKYFLQKF